MLFKTFLIEDTVFYINKYVNGKRLRYYLFTKDECLGVWDKPRQAILRAKAYVYMNK